MCATQHAQLFSAVQLILWQMATKLHPLTSFSTRIYAYAKSSTSDRVYFASVVVSRAHLYWCTPALERSAKPFGGYMCPFRRSSWLARPKQRSSSAAPAAAQPLQSEQP
jgi:hypothetical protein